MKTPLRNYLCIGLFWVAAFVSCEKVPNTPGSGVSPTTGVNGNVPPVANAGEDQVIYIPQLFTRLDGSKSSDPNNDIKTYHWKQISGSTVPIDGIASAGKKEIGINFTSEGIYQFELTVTDVANLVSRDTVQVSVIDNFAPGVAPVFVSGCDTLILPTDENSINVWSEAAVIQGGSTYWLNSGYTYKQLAGPTNTKMVPLNGEGSRVVSVQSLAKGTYTFGIEVERKGLKSYDTTVVRVIDDTASGKEYYFESTWVPAAGGYQSVNAITPSRPEIFFPRYGAMKKYRLWLKLHDSGVWTEVPLVHWMDAEDYYFETDQCSRSINVSYWGEKYKDYAGKKVQMRIFVP